MSEDSIQDYSSKNEEVVLEMVKKYPLYSVNRLAQVLPLVSRHTIQRILEKNKLSTVDKRLEYSSKNVSNIQKFKGLSVNINMVKQKILASEKFRKAFGKLVDATETIPGSAGKIIILLVLLFLFFLIRSYIYTKPPEISLDKPEVGFSNQGEKLFVAGRVNPPIASVKVNGKQVSLNGDGSFTAIASIPMGESTLEVEAYHWGKKAQLLRLVNRIPTEEEQKAQALEEEQRKKESVDRTAVIDRTVNDLLAAKNARTTRAGVLKVIKSQLKEESGLFSVVGEVQNIGEKDLSWVMVTVTFVDDGGTTIDTKYGFATDFNEVIKPGQIKSFQTQSTDKKVARYSLDLSWEEGSGTKEVSPSPQITPSATASAKPKVNEE